MANTPEGTPYVESSDLVANYPAASLALANRVDLVGILPFANASARTTAIPTPSDGQYSYLQDTNSTQFWDGSAWVPAGVTPGLRIVAPTSIANSGGSASATGGEITFTGVSSVSLNGVFSASYLNYRIVMLYTGSSGGSTLRMRMRASGTDSTASSYDYAGFYMAFAGGSPTAGNSGSNLNAWPLAFTNNNANQRGIYMGDWTEPFAAEFTNFAGLQTTNYIQPSGGRFTATTAFDGFTIYPDAGTLTGSIRVYGYQNS